MKVGVVALLLVVLSSTSASGASAPRILYGGSHGDLFVSGLDGSSPVSLTGGMGLAGSARWSPDGTRVVYATNRDTDGHGMSEIYVADADGTDITRLTFDATQTAGAKGSPVWSPDSSAIAYATFGGAVWVIPATGGTPRRLATAPDTVSLVAWSPDGTQLLARGSTGAGHLFAISASDGNVSDLGVLSSPAFSPRGDRIAYQDVVGRVSVMDADATHGRELSTLDSTAPTWIDDHTVAFTGNHQFLDQPETKFGFPSRSNVYVADVDAGEPPHRVTGANDELRDPRQADQPQASPDGKQLLFRWSLVGERWRANVDGTCAQRVPLAATQGGDGVFWQPGAAPGRTDCAELWIAPSADVSPERVALGKPAVLRLTVENHGTETATNVAVHITPATPDAMVGPCSGCQIDSLLPGATATVAYTLSSSSAGAPRATATVTAAEPSPAPELATQTQVVQVLPCTIAGTAGSDRLAGTPRADRICGLPGADYISAGAGNDTISGGSGNDAIFGGPGRDTIDGDDGRDVVFARDGRADTIDCGPQYDVAVVDRFDKTSHCERVLRH